MSSRYIPWRARIKYPNILALAPNPQSHPSFPILPRVHLLLKPQRHMRVRLPALKQISIERRLLDHLRVQRIALLPRLAVIRIAPQQVRERRVFARRELIRQYRKRYCGYGDIEASLRSIELVRL